MSKDSQIDPATKKLLKSNQTRLKTLRLNNRDLVLKLKVSEDLNQQLRESLDDIIQTIWRRLPCDIKDILLISYAGPIAECVKVLAERDAADLVAFEKSESSIIDILNGASLRAENRHQDLKDMLADMAAHEVNKS